MKRKSGFFGSVVGQLKRLAFGMKGGEAPPAALEEFVLEHFMLYHGLVGTSPDNERDYRDVRADIHQAILHRSAVEMAIAFKIPPLWWEDKLEKIFLEIDDSQREFIVTCLLPEDVEATTPPEAVPLKHPDWRVRANTAHALAVMQVHEAVPNMVDALAETEDPLKPSFCHLAYALGKLRAPRARLGLIPHLRSEEHWFRVDAAGALSCWPFNEVSRDLADGLLDSHSLTDYMSVAIARRHRPALFLESDDELTVEAGLEMVTGLTQAAQNTFSNVDLAHETQLVAALPMVFELAQEKPTPRRLNAACVAIGWLLDSGLEGEYPELFDAAKVLQHKLHEDQTIRQNVVNWLRESRQESDPQFDYAQTRHAISLSAQLRIAEAAPYLVPMLRGDERYLAEVVGAVASLGVAGAPERIVGLAVDLVDVEKRTQMPPSKLPVAEDDPAAATLYWTILKALGEMPDESGMNLLIRAAEDFAPDKRQQALASLIKGATISPELQSKFSQSIRDAVDSGLEDSAPAVKLVALQGVAALGLVDFLPAVTKLCGAKEVSIQRQALSTLESIHQSGRKDEVLQAVNRANLDSYARQRVDDMLTRVRQNGSAASR